MNKYASIWTWTIRVEARDQYDTVHAKTFRTNDLSFVLDRIRVWWEKILTL